MSQNPNLELSMLVMREVLENLTALKGEEYVKLVLLWSKFRTLQPLVVDHVTEYAYFALNELVSELFAVILAAYEQKTGKEFNTNTLDQDAATLVGVGLGPLGLRIQR